MYIVRDKATRKIIHVNLAPVSQGLQGADVYYQLDPKTMEVGKGEIGAVPDYFDIDAQGLIVPWTLERQVKEGVKALPPELKAVGDQIVEKTLAEKVADGTVKLKPTEKVAGDQIVALTPAEQVAAGVVKLSPTQVVDGDSVREMTDGEKAAAGLIKVDPRLKLVGKQLVQKTVTELVNDKVVTLASDEKAVGDAVVKLNPRQMLQEGRIDLQAYKQAVTDRYTQVSLEARRKQVPDHLLLYAALGALDAATVEKYRKIAADHAKALDQMAQNINKATTADAVDAAAALGDWAQPPQAVAGASVAATAAASAPTST